MNTKSYLQKRKKKWKKKSGGNKRNRKREMMDRECGTKQLKTVIAKENLKKPKQTQKKTSEQIVFVGLWVWQFVESRYLTVSCGISEKGRKGRKLLQVGLCGSVLRLWVRKLVRRYTMMIGWYEFLPRGIFKKANSRMMTQTAGWWQEESKNGQNRGIFCFWREF